MHGSVFVPIVLGSDKMTVSVGIVENHDICSSELLFHNHGKLIE